MICPNCERLERSHKEKPFVPPTGYKPNQNNLYQCRCGQRWYCYNDYYCLWGKVNDDLTWKFLVNNIEVPFSIGKVCSILPGCEKFSVDPVNKTCDPKVARPEMAIYSADGNLNPTAAFQWFGEYELGNIFQYQFQFPLISFPKEYWEKIKSFVIPFVGAVGQWPDVEQRGQLIKDFKDPEKIIAHLMSAEFSSDFASGKGPLSFISGVVLLGDPKMGVITPQWYNNPLDAEWVLEDFDRRS